MVIGMLSKASLEQHLDNVISCVLYMQLILTTAAFLADKEVADTFASMPTIGSESVTTVVPDILSVKEEPTTDTGMPDGSTVAVVSAMPVDAVVASSVSPGAKEMHVLASRVKAIKPVLEHWFGSLLPRVDQVLGLLTAIHTKIGDQLFNGAVARWGIIIDTVPATMRQLKDILLRICDYIDDFAFLAWQTPDDSNNLPGLSLQPAYLGRLSSFASAHRFFGEPFPRTDWPKELAAVAASVQLAEKVQAFRSDCAEEVFTANTAPTLLACTSFLEEATIVMNAVDPSNVENNDQPESLWNILVQAPDLESMLKPVSSELYDTEDFSKTVKEFMHNRIFSNFVEFVTAVDVDSFDMQCVKKAGESSAGRMPSSKGFSWTLGQHRFHPSLM